MAGDFFLPALTHLLKNTHNTKYGQQNTAYGDKYAEHFDRRFWKCFGSGFFKFLVRSKQNKQACHRNAYAINAV